MNRLEKITRMNSSELGEFICKLVKADNIFDHCYLCVNNKKECPKCVESWLNEDGNVLR